MSSLKSFLKNPYDASYHEDYQPCYLDCVCLMSQLFSFKSIKVMFKEFLNLADFSIKELLPKLISFLISMFILFSIPLGGAFILGAFSYLLDFQPSRRKIRNDRLNKEFERL